MVSSPEVCRKKLPESGQMSGQYMSRCNLEQCAMKQGTLVGSRHLKEEEKKEEKEEEKKAEEEEEVEYTCSVGIFHTCGSVCLRRDMASSHIL